MDSRTHIQIISLCLTQGFRSCFNHLQNRQRMYTRIRKLFGILSKRERLDLFIFRLETLLGLLREERWRDANEYVQRLDSWYGVRDLDALTPEHSAQSLYSFMTEFVTTGGGFPSEGLRVQDLDDELEEFKRKQKKGAHESA